MREKTERIVKDWSPTCDAEVSIAVVGGAWKPTILSMLEQHGVLRFGELSRLLDGTTPREVGRSAGPLLAELTRWGRAYARPHRAENDAASG